MYKNRNKRTIIIGSLLAILICMTIGYAAFSTQLEIAGSSTVTSNWDIQITGITPGTPNGTGENAVAPSYTATTATMEANLYAPGDAMTYEITIENKGTIDAVLDSITKSDSNNPAIIFETSGVNEGDPLLAGDKTTMTVKISYANVTSQPENLTGELSLTLNYVQKPSGGVTPPEPITTDDLKALVVTEGTGLYADSYEAGRYIYKGQNPNNYITFNNETWRIISVESDGALKIIKNKRIGSMAFDADNSNAWETSDIKTYLNETYLPTVTTNQDEILSHTWSIGAVTYNNSDLAGQIKKENETQSQQVDVGLITVSEYLRSNSNMESCETLSAFNINANTCIQTTWIYSFDYSLWTISSHINSTSIWIAGNINPRFIAYNANTFHDVRPVVYLSSDITLIGDGSSENAFQIS